jgi:leucyl aminopeptidase
MHFIKNTDNISGIKVQICDMGFTPGVDLKMGQSLMKDRSLYVAVYQNKDEINYELAGKLIAKAILEYDLRSVVLDLDATSEDLARLAFGLQLRLWKFDFYKADHIADREIAILCKDPAEAANAFQEYKVLGDSMNFARKLAAEPANKLPPKAFVERLDGMTALGIKVSVLDREALQTHKMNAMLAVAQGSVQEPFCVVMEYKGDVDSPESIAFVGKGVCFDSGGLFIKDQKTMPYMKYDKAAAASVVGAIMAIAKNKLKANVIAVIGLVENMPDGNAQKPGDVITSMSGKTIEVADPDAEGRLVLADCLFYASQNYAIKYMISFGTLTGNTVASLASEYAGLFTYDEALASDIIKAGVVSQDKVWRLPLGEFAKKQIRSEIADLKNLGDLHAGDNAAAAEFLNECAGLKRFAHLDIAGVTWVEEDTNDFAKGVTGYGVRLIYELASNSNSKDSIK